MLSPFPGMDPYLERHWPDVHGKLIIYAADALNANLPDELIVRTEERVAVGADDDEIRRFAPDLRAFDTGSTYGFTGSNGGTATMIAPYRLALLDEQPTERFIEILDTRGGERLVTVIEFLSPSNKLKPGVDEFLVKRNQLLAGGVNVVEIDLVRGGNRDRLLPRSATPAAARSEYRVVHFLPNGEVWLHPMPLREPLPTIRIPLRPTDEPAELSLQPLLDDAYKNGRYGRTLDYSRPPEPPLEGEDADWAAALRGGA